MSKDPQDRILETFLKELTRESPKRDFSAEILRKLEAAKAQSDIAEPKEIPLEEVSPDDWILQPLEPAEPVVLQPTPIQPVAAKPKTKTTEGKSSANLALKFVGPVLTVAAVVIICIGIVVWLKQDQPQGPMLADDLDKLNHPTPGLYAEQHRKNETNEQPDVFVQTPNVPRIDPNVHVPPTQNVQIPADQTAIVFPGSYERTIQSAVAAKTPQEVSLEIDRIFQDAWRDANRNSVPPLDMRQWAVRLCNRMIGRAPTASELEQIDAQIAASTDAEQLRNNLVVQFTESNQYRGEFIDHWSKRIAWRLLGLNPLLRTSDEDMQRVRELVASAIEENVSFDQFAYELVSAVGSTNPQQADYNPAASYWIGLAKRFGDLELSSSHISSTFLNHDTRCVQCHESYSDRSMAQNEFWKFRSFLAQMSIEPKDASGYSVMNRNYLPFGSQGSVSAPYEYQAADGSTQNAFPEFGDLKPIDNGFVAIVDRRTELAKHIAESPQWRAALVDFVWTGLLNVPLSIDDEVDAGSLAGQVNQQLGDQLLANDFNLVWLIQTVSMSKPFELGVGTDDQIAADNPYYGAEPLFTRFYHQSTNQRTPLVSLAIVASAYETGEVEQALSAGLLARVDGQAQTPTVENDNTIGEYLPTNDNQWAVDARTSAVLDRIAASSMEPKEKIEHLVLMALSRPVMSEEIEKATIILEQASDQRTALQDVWWSLMNSFEYEFPSKSD